MLNSSFIKKFRLKSFNIEAYEEIGSIFYNDYLYNRIINAFYMDDYRTLAVLTYVKYIPISVGPLHRRLQSNSFYFKFYNHNLKSLSYATDFQLIFSVSYEEEFFFKSIYLGNQYTIFAFTGYTYHQVTFNVLKIDYLSTTKQINPSATKGFYLYNYVNGDSLFEFVKIDVKRLVFFILYQKLNMLIQVQIGIPKIIIDYYLFF